MYNRYRGNSGFVERVEDSPPPPPPPLPEPQDHGPPPEASLPPQPREKAPEPLRRVLELLSPERLGTEDLMLAGLFYLLYRETKDTDFLFLLAGVILF